jgi:hypothetical protein
MQKLDTAILLAKACIGFDLTEDSVEESDKDSVELGNEENLTEFKTEKVCPKCPECVTKEKIVFKEIEILFPESEEIQFGLVAGIRPEMTVTGINGDFSVGLSNSLGFIIHDRFSDKNAYLSPLAIEEDNQPGSMDLIFYVNANLTNIFRSDKHLNEFVFGVSGDFMLDKYNLGFHLNLGYKAEGFWGTTSFDIGYKLFSDQEKTFFLSLGPEFLYQAEKGLLGINLRITRNGQKSIASAIVGGQYAIFGGENDHYGTVEEYKYQLYFYLGGHFFFKSMF